MSAIKNDLLGENFSTAQNKLRKKVMFAAIAALGANKCHRCDELITDVAQLSVEHKESWQRAKNPAAAFYDLNNIAFSHLTCNVKAGAGGKRPKGNYHGTNTNYVYGCRCSECSAAHTTYQIAWRAKNKPTEG